MTPVSAWLDNAGVCQEAIEIAGDLSGVGGTEFESFWAYLLVDEPIVQLLPAYFLPPWAEETVSPRSLRALAVAAKLENARARWIDELVDDQQLPVSPASAHRLNDAIVDRVDLCYSAALPEAPAARFFRRTGTLYARNSLALVLDAKSWESLERPLSLGDYEAHSEVRHSPVRAPLDALLALLDADDDQRARATASWHAWGFGAQLYDDAVDVEEDFRRRTLTWTVGQTLERFGGMVPADPDEFYEAALRGRSVTRTLEHAETYFARAAELARRDFPRWVPVQDGCRRQARALRRDYERLLAPGASEK